MSVEPVSVTALITGFSYHDFYNPMKTVEEVRHLGREVEQHPVEVRWFFPGDEQRRIVGVRPTLYGMWQKSFVWIVPE